jgi:CRP/FNR family transcriptional regulator, anaerobic regulatory protein
MSAGSIRRIVKPCRVAPIAIPDDDRRKRRLSLIQVKCRRWSVRLIPSWRCGRLTGILEGERYGIMAGNIDAPNGPDQAIGARFGPITVKPFADSNPCGHCDARALSVCNALAATDLDRLAAVATNTMVPAGRIFIQEGDPADCFFNLTGGNTKLYKLLPDGRRQITGFMVAGDFLGLAVSDTYAFSAEAMDEVRLCKFSRRRLQALMADFPALERSLLAVASHELVAAQEQMLLLGRKTARERLASFLIARLRQLHGCDHHGQDRLELPMGRADIADYLGLTIETVSRSFSKMKRDGLIGLPMVNSVQLLDRAGLEAIAGGGWLG